MLILQPPDPYACPPMEKPYLSPDRSPEALVPQGSHGDYIPMFR